MMIGWLIAILLPLPFAIFSGLDWVGLAVWYGIIAVLLVFAYMPTGAER